MEGPPEYNQHFVRHYVARDIIKPNYGEMLTS